MPRPRKPKPQVKRSFTFDAEILDAMKARHEDTGVPLVRQLEDALRAYLGMEKRRAAPAEEKP